MRGLSIIRLRGYGLIKCILLAVAAPPHSQFPQHAVLDPSPFIAEHTSAVGSEGSEGHHRVMEPLTLIPVGHFEFAWASLDHLDFVLQLMSLLAIRRVIRVHERPQDDLDVAGADLILGQRVAARLIGDQLDLVIFVITKMTGSAFPCPV